MNGHKCIKPLKYECNMSVSTSGPKQRHSKQKNINVFRKFPRLFPEFQLFFGYRKNPFSVATLFGEERSVVVCEKCCKKKYIIV